MSFPDPWHVVPRYRKYGFAVVGLMMLLILCYSTFMSVIIMGSDLPLEYSETQEWTTLPDLTICSQGCWKEEWDQVVNSFKMFVVVEGTQFDVPARMTRVPGQHGLGRARCEQMCATAQLANVSIKMDAWKSIYLSVGIRWRWSHEMPGCQAVFLETPSKVGYLGYMLPYKFDESPTLPVISLQQTTWKHKAITPWGDTPHHIFKGVSMGMSNDADGKPVYVIDNITDPQRPYKLVEPMGPGKKVLYDWPGVPRSWDGSFYNQICAMWFLNEKDTVTTITAVGKDYQIARMLGSLGGFITIIGFAFAVCFEKKYPLSKEVTMNQAMTLRGTVTEREDYVEGDEEYEDSEEEAL